MKKIGIAMSGGGMSAVVHLGVLKALNEPLAYAFTKEEFLKLCEDGAISRQTKMIKFQQLRYLVYQAKTEAEIDAINW